jgi:hypothetical protein
MVKNAVVLLSFLAYSLVLIHSIVPHHHHDEHTSEHRHFHDSKDHHHHGDDHEENSLSHAFADVIHFPGAEVAIHPRQVVTLKHVSTVGDLLVTDLTQLLLSQLKPPDLNVDRRQAHYSSTHQSLFLLRAPPVA